MRDAPGPCRFGELLSSPSSNRWREFRGVGPQELDPEPPRSLLGFGRRRVCCDEQGALRASETGLGVPGDQSIRQARELLRSREQRVESGPFFRPELLRIHLPCP
jgi:hypothetical protein